MGTKKLREKPLYSTWQNIFYVIKGAWKYDRIVFLYFGAFTLFSSVQPFITIFFPKWILTELMGQKRTDILLYLLAGFFVAAASFGYLVAWLRGAYYPHMTRVRMGFIMILQEKCMTTDFKNTENPQFLSDRETAFRCLNSNNDGIEGMLHKLFSLAGNMIALCGYIAIVASLNVFIMLFLVFNVLVTYFLTFAGRKYEHSKKDEVSDADRRSGYLYNIMYDFSYGKELRLLGISDLISSMYKEFKDKRLGILKKVKWRYFAFGLVDILLLLTREAVVYAYLVYLVIQGGMTIPNFTMYFATITGFAGGWLLCYKIVHTLGHRILVYVISGRSLDLRKLMLCIRRKFHNHHTHLNLRMFHLNILTQINIFIKICL